MTANRYGPWATRLETIREQGRFRSVFPITPTGPTTGIADGRELILACTNDYLGLAWDPSVRAAGLGGGSGGSRLIKDVCGSVSGIA